MTTTTDLSDRLLRLTTEVLSELEAGHAPGLRLPRVLGGHVVGPDARADLAFTLGLLHHAGVEEVAGLSCADIALEAVRTLDGDATHTFYSYRAAETLLRFGGLDDNPALAGWTSDDRANAEAAIDSSAMLERLEAGELPKNFAVVLTRCELARTRLGRLPDERVLDRLVEQVAALFGRLETGWWDDWGASNFDMYTPDVYLFAEPFADRLGDVWTEGFRKVAADVADLATPGGAISWGRSTGALGIVMNVELGATAAARGLTDDVVGWLGRADLAARALRGWFCDGLVTAHQHRRPMGYRGPARRLQMTLDLLGKLVQSALELRQCPEVVVGTPAESYPRVDRVVVFDPATRASAWAHRGGGADFVVPFVGGFWVDYTASPRWPGTYEVPVDNQTLVSMLPAVHADGVVRTTTGPPSELTHVDGVLEVCWDLFSSMGSGGDEARTAPVGGSRRARYRVVGRTLVVDEQLTIERDPATIEALSIAVPEVSGRPLAVEFSTDRPHTVATVDTAGMVDHRSFWNEHVRVHELSVEPAAHVDLRWEVTPQLRVVSTAARHWYNTSLYAPLGDRVRCSEAVDLVDDPAAMADFDLFHMHWPEWVAGTDPARSEEIIADVRAAGLPILWTQHNRVPHLFPDAGDVYEIWAAAADGVIHHSEYGRRVMEHHYRYGDRTRHLVVPHGHWGDRYEAHRPSGGRAEAAELSGLPAAPLRLGVVGAPRASKDVQLVIDAVHRCRRDDVQLCVWSLTDEKVPDDPRIVAHPYDLVPEDVYARRLFALDALVMPFDDGMLTTGTVADAVAVGLPTLASPWEYLTEALGEAAILYGESADDLAACIDALTADRLATAGRAAAALRADTDWSNIAQTTLAFIDDLVVSY